MAWGGPYSSKLLLRPPSSDIPLLIRSLAGIAGALVALLSPGPWPFAGVLVAAAAATAALAAWRGALLLASFLAIAALAEARVASLFALQGVAAERVVAVVRIDSLPQPAGTGRHFEGWMRLPRRPEVPERRISVRWAAAAGQQVAAGETWQLAVNLRPFAGRLNPGAVDERRLAWRDRVSASANVLASPLNRRLAPAGNGLLQLRERIANGILARVPDPAAAALLAALAVGYTGDVEARHWRLYNLTGITHLIAISGMHVTLFAVCVMGALRRVWAMSPRLAVRCRRDTFAASGGLLAATGYALLAGFSVPTQRTLLMLVAAIAWRHCARASSPACALGAAVLLILATDPCAVLAAGFWLSCGAVGIILWREAARLRPAAGWQAALRLQFLITGALAPATFAQFGSVPLAGLWVNPLAIPWFSLLLVPLALIASALLMTGTTSIAAAPVLWMAEIATKPLLALLSKAGSVGWALWQARPPVWTYGAGAVAVLTMLVPVGARVRLAVAVAAVLPLLTNPRPPASGQASVLLLASGNAPIAIVRTRHHALLYGTGDTFGTGGARVASLVLPAALVEGVREWDLAIATGLDRDVAAGIGALAARSRVRRFASGPTTMGEWPPGIDDCGKLGGWEWDGVRFESDPATRGRGCSLRIVAGGSEWRIEPRRAAAESPVLAERWTSGPLGTWAREAAIWPWGAWNGDAGGR